MELLIEQLYSEKYEKSYLECKIENYSLKAETITSYLYDTTKM